MTTANIIEELGRIEEWITDLAENEDLTGSDYRDDLPGMAQQLYAIRYAIQRQPVPPRQRTNGFLKEINDDLEAILDGEDAECSGTTGDIICEVQ